MYRECTVTSLFSPSQVMAKLQLLLEVPTERNTAYSWERKVKDYYQTCMRDFTAEQMKGLLLLELIKNIGWNVIDDVDIYNITDWRDFKASLQQAQGEYLVSAFFKISVVPTPSDASQPVIKVNVFRICFTTGISNCHDDVIKWNHFPGY